MKTGELRRLGALELAAELEKTQKDLFSIKCKVALGEDAKTHAIRGNRRAIARIKTIQRQMAVQDGSK